VEIEEVIRGHPAVAEVVCFGVVDPAGGGHIPRAVLTLQAKAVTSRHEIQAYVDCTSTTRLKNKSRIINVYRYVDMKIQPISVWFFLQHELRPTKKFVEEFLSFRSYRTEKRAKCCAQRPRS
jgi:hypothetical protein